MSKRVYTQSQTNRLWHAGWQYREMFGHVFVDGDPDKGCIHGCPGCYFDATVRDIQDSNTGSRPE